MTKLTNRNRTTPGRTSAAPFFLAAAAIGVTALPALAQDISVTVNDSPVPFAGQGPVQRAGSVLVPLRGVFEKLGASVQYDSATKTILAVKGPTTVSLRLGQSQALVNGVAQGLSTPAQAVFGTTLVPLRFVSEALGAQVEWDAPSRTVRVQTGAAVAASLPEPGRNIPGAITGTVTGVFPEDNSITIRLPGGGNTRVPLAVNAVIQVRAGQETATSVGLNALRLGDQVTVRRDADGRATLVEAAYNERSGEVKNLRKIPATGNYRLVLTDGTRIEVASGAPVTMAGRSASLEDIKAGEQVVVRVNPQTNMATGIAVATGGNPTPTPPSQVQIPGPVILAPLANTAVGNVVTLTGNAVPGATVRVTVTYEVKVLGNILSSKGTLREMEILTDAQGRWTTGGISLQDINSNAALTARVVTLGANGAVSNPATVSFKR